MAIPSYPEEMMFDLFGIDAQHKGDVPLIRMTTAHFRKCKDYTSLIAHVLNIASIAVIQSKGQHHRDTNLFDLQVEMMGTEYSNVDIGFFRNLLKTLVKMFPNMLRRCEIHNSPGFFPALYKLLSPLIPKETRQKIHIIRKNTLAASEPILPTTSASLLT